MSTCCAACGVPVASTVDRQLYSWPDGVALCLPCHDERADREDYGDVVAAVERGSYVMNVAEWEG